MDEERWRLTPDGYDAVTEGGDLDDDEIFFARVLQSYEALEMGGATEDELVEIVRWYEQALADQSLIEMVMKGLLYVYLNDGEVTFKATLLGQELGKDYARTHGFDLPDADDLPSLD